MEKKKANGTELQTIEAPERQIPEDAYGPIDTDLARDNLENDIPYADLQDL